MESVSLPLLIAAVSVPTGLCGILWAQLQRLDTRRAEADADLYKRLLDAERRSADHAVQVAERYVRVDHLRTAIDSAVLPLRTQQENMSGKLDLLAPLPERVAHLSAQVQMLGSHH